MIRTPQLAALNGQIQIVAKGVVIGQFASRDLLTLFARTRKTFRQSPGTIEADLFRAVADRDKNGGLADNGPHLLRILLEDDPRREALRASLAEIMGSGAIAAIHVIATGSGHVRYDTCTPGTAEITPHTLGSPIAAKPQRRYRLSAPDGYRRLVADEGAGYPIDIMLRRRLAEIEHHRVAWANDEKTCQDFSVETLYQYVDNRSPSDKIVKMLPEIDHAFDLQDYLFYMSSRLKVEQAPMHAAAQWAHYRELKEATIYNYTPLNAWMTYESGRLRISGLSVVRHKSLLHYVVQFGLDVTNVAWIASIEKNCSGLIRKQTGRPFVPQTIPDNPDAWEAHLSFTVDLNSGKMAELAITLEVGCALDIPFGIKSRTGILNAYDKENELYNEDVSQKSLWHKLPARDMFYGALDLIDVGTYFKAKINYIRDETIERAVSGPRALTVPPLASNKRYRVVKTLVPVHHRHEGTEQNIHRRPPDYQVPAGGVWRRLKAGSWGKGPDGKPQFERTWVTEHVRYKDKPQRPRVIFTKASVQAALADSEKQARPGSVTMST